ncbi:hypothetical protein Sjap_003606 [Stephania japonica]|uniref:F-box protein n=1 Tax=Stephania japonica TaxID=461633 RepID=A0AAP0KP39_9MAGN
MATSTDSKNFINGGEEDQDRLSNLSNDILHDIFSRLNPKYSVQASILGRRWRHLWRSLPNLNFKSDNPPQKSFLGFLNQVLIQSRDTSVDIQSFHLCYKDEAIPRDVFSTWVFAAVVRNVERLAIELPLEKGPVQLPWCLFNSKSLVNFDLGFGHEYPQFVLPSLIDFPKLKSLRLRNVAFVEDVAITRLVSSCPSLEKLVMVVGGVSFGELLIVAPKLEKLRLTLTRYSKAVEGFAIKLRTPNLKNFCWDGYRAEVPQQMPDRIGVATIGMHLEFHKKIGVPFKAIKMSEYRRKKFVRLATKLAEAARDAQSLLLCGRIVEEQFSLANTEECWELQMSKECLLRHLKFVTVEGVVGCVNEFKLLEFLLKYAVALDKVTINEKLPNKERELINLRKKLMEIPRASPKDVFRLEQ